MKAPLNRWQNRTGAPRTGGGASPRLLVAVLTAFVAGAAITAFWLQHSRTGPSPATRPNTATAAPILSESTRAVLARLEAPLSVRYYSILDPASVPPTTVEFAQRAGQLLEAYQQAAAGKLKLTRYDSPSTDAAESAAADDITGFNLAKGNACYLGVALELKGRKESLPELSPDFEPALESDLTRAISRLLDSGQPPVAPVAASQVNTTAVQEVKALIPDPGAVSLAEGTRLLREAALKEFKAAAQEMQGQIQQAEQELVAARNSQSATDQQTAMQRLQQLQAEQDRKLKDIAAQAQARVQAFQQLKASP